MLYGEHWRWVANCKEEIAQRMLYGSMWRNLAVAPQQFVPYAVRQSHAAQMDALNCLLTEVTGQLQAEINKGVCESWIHQFGTHIVRNRGFQKA